LAQRELSRRNSGNGRNLNLKVIGARIYMPHGLSVISVISAGNQKIVSSVRDKNNSQSDWREIISITEETEIIGKETEN
jgi:hypothetical protein